MLLLQCRPDGWPVPKRNPGLSFRNLKKGRRCHTYGEGRDWLEVEKDYKLIFIFSFLPLIPCPGGKQKSDKNSS